MISSRRFRLGRRSMDSINHRLHRLLLSANLVEHVFEGLGSVIGVSSRLSQKQEQPSTLVTYVTLVKGWFQKCVFWFQKHTFEANSFINVEIFNNLLLHDLFYIFIVFLRDIPSFTIFTKAVNGVKKHYSCLCN